MLVPHIEPRRWQREAFAAWKAQGHGIVHVATGAGKTVFAEMCIDWFLSEHPKGAVVVVVPTLSLVEQWDESLREDIGIDDVDISIFSMGSVPPARRINLMTSVAARTQAPEISTRVEGEVLLVADECHRIASTENAKALSGPYGATLGLSATPQREHDDLMETVLVPALGPIIYSYDYARALADGVITGFSLVNVGIDFLPFEAERYETLSTRVAQLVTRRNRGEDVEKQLQIALQRRASVAAEARMRIPCAVHLMDESRGVRSIIFHERIRAAEQIHRLLRKRGHRATLYHSGIATAMRRDNLRLFRQGVFDVLVTCRALDEGLDVPDAALGIIASSTASHRQRVQRMGRVLRSDRSKHHSVVCTIYVSRVEEERLALEEIQGNSGASKVEWRRVRSTSD